MSIARGSMPLPRRCETRWCCRPRRADPGFPKLPMRSASGRGSPDNCTRSGSKGCARMVASRKKMRCPSLTMAGPTGRGHEQLRVLLIGSLVNRPEVEARGLWPVRQAVVKKPSAIRQERRERMSAVSRCGIQGRDLFGVSAGSRHSENWAAPRACQTGSCRRRSTFPFRRFRSTTVTVCAGPPSTAIRFTVSAQQVRRHGGCPATRKDQSAPSVPGSCQCLHRVEIAHP